jgi:hypothetical protein
MPTSKILKMRILGPELAKLSQGAICALPVLPNRRIFPEVSEAGGLNGRKAGKAGMCETMRPHK